MTGRNAMRRPARRRSTYCHTCDRHFHHLGIARHTAMPRDRREDCTVTYTHGDTFTFAFSERQP